MTGFSNLTSYVNSLNEGRNHYTTWRKTPSQVTTAGIWFDMSMSPGNPNPQYYAATPLIAQQMKRSTDGGLNHGSDVTPYSKYVHRFLMLSNSATGLPMPYILCDYLLYYPFIDTGTNDQQDLTNSVTLPRYTDGVGVQMMAVSVASNSGTSPTFTVSYTNSSGTASRTTPSHVLNTSTANGSIITSSTGATISTGAFIALQAGDSGVRSVQSVTFTSGTDVGLFALVLVKPIMTGVILEQTAPSEVMPISHMAVVPKITDDAYLNLLTLPNGSLSGIAFHGELETVFN